tara:strand:+ start:23117 stop:23614 length:498 start_codon:yes stop_codon:yes gene_type:complete
MKNPVYIILLSAFLFACQSGEHNSNNDSIVHEVSENEVVVPNYVATIEIDGMACVMSCGGSIKKALRKTDGVSSMEFDFEADRETNILTVSFSDGMVTIEEIKSIISDLNNKQFTIGKVSSKSIHKNTATNQKDCPYKERTQIETVSTSFEMPSLLDILSSFLPR